MLIPSVLRTGHVQLRVLDLEESVHFYTDVLGLKETGRDATNRVYFKAWDERDHSSLILQEDASPGLAALAFKVLDDDHLDRAEKGLAAYGIKGEWIDGGDLLEIGRRLRFTSVAGHQVDLYSNKTDVGRDVPDEDPPAWDESSERGMGISRLDHCVLYGPKPEEAAQQLVKALGFYVTEQVDLADRSGDLGVWLSSSTRACDIAFVQHDAPGKLHHLAFRVANAEQLLRAADTLSMNRVQIDAGPFRDPIGRKLAVQAFDPSRNRIEIFTGGYDCYPDGIPIRWSWKAAGRAIAARDQRTLDRIFPVVS